MRKPVVLGVERVNNPHLVPLLLELRRRDDLDFTGCILQSLPPWRVELGWPELPDDTGLLAPWRRPDDARRYAELARTADVAIWPGPNFPASVRLIGGRNWRRQLNVLWAERFIGRRERSWLATLAVKGVVRLLDSPYTHLMTLGDGAAEDYRAYGARRWPTWQFGYSVAPVTEEPRPRPLAPGVLRLMFLGALRSKKGVDVLLRALGAPALASGGWQLTLAGDGKERAALTSLAESLGIARRVTWSGVVPHERVPDLYRTHDVLVLPSRYEGWGAVMNEAMEHGLPVVASDGAGGARLLVAPEESGFIVPAGDDVALSACLARLVREPELVARLAAGGRRRIEQFRPAAAAARVAALLHGLTGCGPMPQYADGLCAALPPAATPGGSH